MFSFLKVSLNRVTFISLKIAHARGWDRKSFELLRHLKFLNCSLKIKELDEFHLQQFLLVHSSSNSKSYKGSNFRFKKTPFPIFSAPT